MTSYISKARGSVASANAYALDKDAPNGKIRNQINLDKNSSDAGSLTDNFERLERNGWIITDTIQEESHPMVELKPPKENACKSEESPLIFSR